MKLLKLPEDLKRLVSREWSQGDQRKVKSAAHHVAVFIIEAGGFIDLGRIIGWSMALGMLAQYYCDESTPESFITAVEARLEEDL